MSLLKKLTLHREEATLAPGASAGEGAKDLNLFAKGIQISAEEHVEAQLDS